MADLAQQRRQAMPQTSAFVALMRAALGDQVVDEQLSKAQQALRTYTTILQSHGLDAAEAWRLEHAEACTFFAQEGGRRVGLATPYGEGVLPAVDSRVMRAQAVAYGRRVR